MRRYLIAGLATVAIGGVAAVAAAAGPPRATLRDFICQRALDPANRAISIVAVMRPLPGTEHMALRFELLSKAKGGAQAVVHGGDLGTWVSPSNPTLGQRSGDVWVINKPVVNLAAPASYRFRVAFRWTGAHHHTLGTIQLQSPNCYQPELRPDLLVQAISVQPMSGKPNEDRYVAVIRNAGDSAAGRFEVDFADHGSSQTATIHHLGAHASRSETFVGPVCSTSAPPTVTVDPQHAIDDLDPGNNTLAATCPAA